MSLIENILKPAGLNWLRKPAPARAAEDMVKTQEPSLASIEYELRQLRASLNGVMHLQDQAPSAVPHFVALRPDLMKRGSDGLIGELVNSTAFNRPVE
jgi:hypothetical protein